MDFVKVPVASRVNPMIPFGEGLIIGNQGYNLDITIATLEGDVYAARVNDYLYFICIGYGYYGYSWISGASRSDQWEVAKTDWNSIYDVKALLCENWTYELTNFASVSEMENAFYDEYVSPYPSDRITVVVNAGTSTSENITVEVFPYVDGADFIDVIVTGKGKEYDPNDSGGTSTEGGGDGDFDDTSDPIPIPPLPTVSAANSGLITLFRPSLEELQALGSYLWTNINDFIENLNKLFMNPMDYLIALNIFPCMPSVGNPRAINIGSFTTTIEMPPLVSQWYSFDCGVIDVQKYWGSALDYSPNTKMSLFLPFIGSVPINTDEVMGRKIGVTYRIDLLSGQCVAMVSIGDTSSDMSVYYQFTGECSVSVPLTGADWSRVYSAAISAAGSLVTSGVSVMSTGAGASVTAVSAMHAAAKASDSIANAGQAYAMINSTSKGIAGVAQMRNDMLEASRIALTAGRQAASATPQLANGIKATRIANGINNTMGAVMGAKGHISHSGSISGSAGMLGVKTPYLLIEYPNQSLAENYKHFVGYPSNIYARLGDLSGYTECEQVILNSSDIQTDAEMSELVESLKGGVYL